MRVYIIPIFLKTIVFSFLSCIVCFVNQLQADVVTFGSGANTFTLNFKTVGNPGNNADTSWSLPGIGSPGRVNYSYGISEFEITERMIDIYNLHVNANMRIGYESPGRGPNKPATEITWNEAARFVNWLNESSGDYAAYKYSGDINANLMPWDAFDDEFDWNEFNEYRSLRTRFVLPSMNEWYKAAYYDPRLNNGSGGYWKYSVQTNGIPNAVTSGTGAQDVVYRYNVNGVVGVDGTPADVNNAGGLSAYGVMAMNGNVWEWLETPESARYGSGLSQRALAGGSWADMFATNFAKEQVVFYSPNTSLHQGGFRIVSLLDWGNDNDGGGGVGAFSSVPEPSTTAAFLGVTACAVMRRLRTLRRKR